MKTVQEWLWCPQVLLALCSTAVVLPAAKAQVRSSDFDVTDGKIEQGPGKRLRISTKEMRATLKYTTEQNVTVNFTYLGSTNEVAYLGSGQVRSQFGIKLRAQDTCNIVYVMWHFAPEHKIAVSVKCNPGMTTHHQCLDHGYINNIKPRISDVAPPVQVNQPHVLSASINGSDLTVTADNKLVWSGDLGPVSLTFNGPVGLRSDNARLLFDFFVKRDAF